MSMSKRFTPIDGKEVITADLHDWELVKFGDKTVLFGNVENDIKRRFPDGTRIRTSLIDKVEDGIAYTLNSAYRLIGEGITQ